jgi:hypothetical protein
MSTKVKAPTWFWIVSIILLLWNLMGLAAFAIELASPELVTADFSEEQMRLYDSRPSWYMFNFAVAVFAGTLACVLLLARRKFAVTLAILSLISVLVSTAYTATSGALDAVGVPDQVLFYMVLILDVVLVIFAMRAARKRWIV